MPDHWRGSLEHLRASHIRPWRHSDNQTRLDGENGLLLTPSIDPLFEGFISFEDNGRLLFSPVAHAERMGIETDTVFNVGGFSEGQPRSLDTIVRWFFSKQTRTDLLLD
jgi:hypothetical protein